MKKTVIATVLASGAALGAHAAEMQSVTPAEFQKIIADTTVQLLDVRTPDEFAAGHLAGAANIDVLADGFLEKALAHLNPERTVAIYCRSGRRSKQAASLLLKHGFCIKELDNGYLGWVAEGLPVAAPGK